MRPQGHLAPILHNSVPLQQDLVPLVMNPSYIERYKRLNPFIFVGVSTFEKAECWLVETENAFTTLGVVSKQKVILVTYMLMGEAGRWWQLKQITLPIPVT